MDEYLINGFPEVVVSNLDQKIIWKCFLIPAFQDVVKRHKVKFATQIGILDHINKQFCFSL